MTTQSARLFIALAPPAKTRQALTRLRNSLAALTTARPVSSENLHLTLAFLGQVAPSRQAELLELLREMPKLSGRITLDTLGHFARARVLWAGCSRPNSELDKLANLLRERLGARGFSFDPAPFRPHVTLFRKAEPLQHPIKPPIHWSFGVPQLFASIATPEGICYRIIHDAEISD